MNSSISRPTFRFAFAVDADVVVGQVRVEGGHRDLGHVAAEAVLGRVDRADGPACRRRLAGERRASNPRPAPSGRRGTWPRRRRRNARPRGAGRGRSCSSGAAALGVAAAEGQGHAGRADEVRGSRAPARSPMGSPTVWHSAHWPLAVAAGVPATLTIAKSAKPFESARSSLDRPDVVAARPVASLASDAPVGGRGTRTAGRRRVAEVARAGDVAVQAADHAVAHVDPLAAPVLRRVRMADVARGRAPARPGRRVIMRDPQGPVVLRRRPGRSWSGNARASRRHTPRPSARPGRRAGSSLDLVCPCARPCG